MKKKLLYISSIIITIIFLSLSIILNTSYSKFNSNNVKDSITYLSSDDFKGRLAGTEENSLVANIIKNKFTSYRLSSLNDNYFENFTVTCPTFTDSEGYLKIISSSGTENFQYGVDFKEDMINFKNNTFTFSTTDKISIFSSFIEVECSDGKVLFYTNKDNSLSFRSSFLSDYSYDATIIITTDTYNSIVSALKTNKTITVHIPFINEEKIISNVVAVLKGSNSDLSPLVITAHFDHLGTDGVGNVYGGALDNSSGISFILELARSLSTYGTPNRDIIFVALNAEEFGLLGSKFFAENNYFYIKNSMVINFDMIGASETPITLMQGSSLKNTSSNLLNSITSICDTNSIEYEVTYENSSDHASFNDLGIDSLTFCHSDTSKIHTPEDTVDYIDTAAIDTVYSVVEEEIKSSCYNKFTIFLYSSKSISLFSIILLTLVIIGFLNTKFAKNGASFK